MDSKHKTKLQREAVDDAIQLNHSHGNRELQRLLIGQEIQVSHTYVANRRRVLGIPNAETLGSRFKGQDGSIINVSSAKSEQEIEEAVAHYYRTSPSSLDVKTQVPSIIGPADIVVDGTVLEVKLLLRREHIFKAVGQVLAYQSVVGDPNKRGCIVAGGYALAESELIGQVVNLGVNILLWNDERLVPWAEFCTTSPHPVKLDG